MSSAHVDLSIHLDDDSFGRLDDVISKLEQLAGYMAESARDRHSLPSPLLLGGDETQVVRTPITDETAVMRGIGMPDIEPRWVDGYAAYVNDNNEEVWVKDGEFPAPSLRQLFVERKRRV